MTKEEIEMVLDMAEIIVAPERAKQFSSFEKKLAQALLFVHKTSVEALRGHELNAVGWYPEKHAERARLALDDIGARE